MLFYIIHIGLKATARDYQKIRFGLTCLMGLMEEKHLLIHPAIASDDFFYMANEKVFNPCVEIYAECSPSSYVGPKWHSFAKVKCQYLQ